MPTTLGQARERAGELLEKQPKDALGNPLLKEDLIYGLMHSPDSPVIKEALGKQPRKTNPEKREERFEKAVMCDPDCVRLSKSDPSLDPRTLRIMIDNLHKRRSDSANPIVGSCIEEVFWNTEALSGLRKRLFEKQRISRTDVSDGFSFLCTMINCLLQTMEFEAKKSREFREIAFKALF